MCSIPRLGAFKAGTRDYVYPAVANRTDRYVCPECCKDLILRQGAVRVHHFAHAGADVPCTYYSRPSESQIHKDAKMLMKTLLEKKTPMTLIRTCSGLCRKREAYEIPQMTESSRIVIEYRFNYNGLKVADVAFIDDGNVVCLFEIYHTHRTAEVDRTGDWFEIDAVNFINTVNRNDAVLKLECMRQVPCDDCELIDCTRCKNTVRRIEMDTKYNDRWCKSCGIEMFNTIYLWIPFDDVDEIRSYGGRFDRFYKKWYIKAENPHKDLIMSKWSRWRNVANIGEIEGEHEDYYKTEMFIEETA